HRRSHAGAVRAHLRIELPATGDRVRSGHAAIPARASLSAGAAAAAVVPPARPPRPGRGAVPVPRRGAGGDPGTARRGLCGVFHRQPRGGVLMALMLMNERTGATVASRVELALDRSTRNRGLLGR